MSTSLDGHLFDSLLNHPAAAANRPPEAELAGSLWLHTDLGPSFYLTRDGQVLVTDAFDDSPPRQATPDERCAGLVVGARNLACLGLLDLLPPMPNGAVVCARCDGRRWSTIHPLLHELIICPNCAGRGWDSSAGV